MTVAFLALMAAAGGGLCMASPTSRPTCQLVVAYSAGVGVCSVLLAALGAFLLTEATQWALLFKTDRAKQVPILEAT